MRYLKFLKNWRPIFVLAVFLPACYGGSSGPKPIGDSLELTCYDFDSSQTIRFNFKGEGIKTYVLVKKAAQITAAKIKEGEPFGLPNRTGKNAYATGVSRLRKVGLSEPPRVDIYWLDKSYKNDNTEDFIFAFQEVLEGGNYLFDVYGDGEKFPTAASLPDFVKDCQLEGGGNIVPIDDPGTEFPPVVIEMKDVDNTGYESNYNEHVGDYTEKYTHDKIAPPVSIPNQADQIGAIILRGAGDAKPHKVFYHAGTLFLKDQNDANLVYQYSPVVGEVALPSGSEPELQLKTLKFITPFVWGWWVAECKPAIYFYPEEKTDLVVKIDPRGFLTQSEPLYNGGWQITAYPDGRLLHEGRYLKHLDYEARLPKVSVPSRGFVIKGSELDAFFTNLLPKLGLNDTETSDFKDYWLSRLTKKPYYFVTLLPEGEIERIEPLLLSTEPDTFIRVRFYFKGLDSPIEVSPPKFRDAVAREGFTVVEWGGVVEDEAACR